jgi:Mrp family chromosome partitioning ATPase
MEGAHEDGGFEAVRLRGELGDLDFLLVDLPPGTSDEPISAVQLIPDLDGAIVVTTPQEVALLDPRKAVNMFQMMEVPVLGMVENMSGFVSPLQWGGKHLVNIFQQGWRERAAMELGVAFLGTIPLDAEVGRLGDRGQAFVDCNTPVRESFEMAVSEVLKRLSAS